LSDAPPKRTRTEKTDARTRPANPAPKKPGEPSAWATMVVSVRSRDAAREQRREKSRAARDADECQRCKGEVSIVRVPAAPESRLAWIARYWCTRCGAPAFGMFSDAFVAFDRVDELPEP
jgi:hypothetical protein